MDQVNYRGYARSVGFDPIKAPYRALDRMQERDSQIIRGMEENRREIRAVRDQYGSGLERKFTLEQQNLKENFAWEDKLSQNRQQSIERNAQRLIDNAKLGGNGAAVFESLAKFSTTIFDTITEYKKAKSEADYLEGVMDIASGRVSPQRQAERAQREDLLKRTGEAQDQIAEGFQQKGADPLVVMGLLSGNKARDYGRLKTYTEMLVAEFPGYAQSMLDELGATTAPDRQALASEIFSKFLKDNGIFGLNADFMAPALMKMRGSYNALLDDARRSDIVTRSSELRDDALAALYRGKSGEALTEAFRAISRSYEKDGRTPVGRANAKALIFDELKDTTRYSDQDVERILNESITDQGTSWRERFAREYDDLVLNRRKDSEAEFQVNDAEERRAQKRAEDQLIDWVSSKWNGSEETLKSIINEAETKGIPTDRLKAYLAQSTEQKNEEFWNKQFTSLYEQGLLTTEEVDQPNVPIQVRETWRNRAQQLDTQRSEAGIKQETIKSELTDALRQNLIGDSTSRTPHYSLRGAADFALRLYNQKFAQYSKTIEPAKAAEKARLDVLTAIEQKKGRFAVISSSSAKVGQTQAFYASFTPGKHPGAPTAADPINASLSIRKFRTNPNVLNEEVLVSPGILREIDARIKNGKPISIPPLYQDLSRGSNLSAVEILNRQLKAAGLQSQVQPGGFRDQLNQINDPTLQRILNQPLTQDRLNTVINGSGNAPATVRTGNAGYSDVVSLGSVAGFKFPQVMAAMWALESGWGKYHSGRNNVFNIKARTGQGTLKNGSYWRDYESPLESAKDFMNLMTDPRYAGGLASARTPRQAVMAIAAGGYAGGEPDYPDKIMRVLRTMGVNVDQEYRPAPPQRNTAYMRPTLAYITSDLGSPGQPHLDVKQMDNPDTPNNEFRQRFTEDALDNYVFVEDPEFGRIPIGTLRKKLPGRGDNFDQHVARGSHGIDYPTQYNSQIFVQNGARIVAKSRTQWGDKVVIQLPDGRRFSFLHGKGV